MSQLFHLRVNLFLEEFLKHFSFLSELSGGPAKDSKEL